MTDPHGEPDLSQQQLCVFGPELAGLQMAACRVLPADDAMPSTAAEHATLPPWPKARRQQYRAGRMAAATALARYGVSGVVGRQADGAPSWPSGFVGSLAHTDQRAMAVVAPSGIALALGIDIEPDLPLPDDALVQVLTIEDRRAIEALALRLPHSASHLARWVFSAKECVHKALNPLNGAWLELDAVWIDWLGAESANHGRWQPKALHAEASAALGGLTAQGYWWLDRGDIATLLVLKASKLASP